MAAFDEVVASLQSPPPRGAFRVPLGDDGIIRPSEGGKMWFKDVVYTRRGPIPFVCGTCVSYDSDSAECDKVEGPYLNGAVLSTDTCVLWKAAADMTDGGPVQGDDESQDTVPAMLSPREYVATEEQVENLGGEEVLEEARD